MGNERANNGEVPLIQLIKQVSIVYNRSGCLSGALSPSACGDWEDATHNTNQMSRDSKMTERSKDGQCSPVQGLQDFRMPPSEIGSDRAEWVGFDQLAQGAGFV